MLLAGLDKLATPYTHIPYARVRRKKQTGITLRIYAREEKCIWKRQLCQAVTDSSGSPAPEIFFQGFVQLHEHFGQTGIARSQQPAQVNAKHRIVGIQIRIGPFFTLAYVRSVIWASAYSLLLLNRLPSTSIRF